MAGTGINGAAVGDNGWQSGSCRIGAPGGEAKPGGKAKPGGNAKPGGKAKPGGNAKAGGEAMAGGCSGGLTVAAAGAATARAGGGSNGLTVAAGAATARAGGGSGGLTVTAAGMHPPQVSGASGGVHAAAAARVRAALSRGASGPETSIAGNPVIPAAVIIAAARGRALARCASISSGGAPAKTRTHVASATPPMLMTTWGVAAQSHQTVKV